MRWRALKWIVVSVLLLAGAALFWQVRDRRVARDSTAAPAAPARARALDTTPRSLRHSEAFRLLTTSVEASKSKSTAALRLRNANFTAAEWTKRPTAVLLENALIDTAAAAPAIPAHLRAQGDPGTFIVQARGRIDESFRAALRQAGARIVSYIPNNAYLVRATGEAAQALAGQSRVQSVLPYEPYYKLKTDLLLLAVGNADLPLDEPLNVALFADAHDDTVAALRSLGAEILAEEPSPFGPVVTVRPRPDTLVALAGLPGVQVIEVAGERVPANDRGRARLGVATNTVAPDNWLGLTGNNVLVNVNDSGVDATHPDLAGRMFALNAASLLDENGHGTHVIGTIAGNGVKSDTVTSTNVPGSVTPVTNGQFRGEAPAARVFVQPVGFINRPGVSAGAPGLSDSDLQTTAAQTNAFIVNNSWHYGGNNGYDLAAARYDAATRDALPGQPGAQPLLFVFAAGNAGRGDGSGLGGDPDSLRSPGTAKNVITVGAIEQNRDITNTVVLDCHETTVTNEDDTLTNVVVCLTNTAFQTETDSDDQVAAFSGRGNTGIGVEGSSGRFKPDVVAPGVWVISTRSAQWNEAEYSNPTNYYTDSFPDLIVEPSVLNNYAVFLVPNAVRFFIDLFPNAASPSPFPDLPIYVKQSSYPTTNSYDFIRTNRVAMPPDGGPSLTPVDAPWNYSVGNPYTNAVSFNLVTTVATTNDMGNEFEVRSNLNATLSPYYRYESGSSMAAAHVSGTLALMQEFFEQRLRRTNSPALMKALLINGARSLGLPYDLEVRTTHNYQGWGLPNLPSTLPASLTNYNPQAGGPMFLFDQDPAKALATGETHIRRIHLTDPARTLPLRITLVWTDPPGNPAAGVKLVNDLDLVVTNLDTGEVYCGNDIEAGSDFNRATPTNSAPNVDVVNNVENVYLPAILGTNYAIGVIGSRVNVNAVTADPDNTAQDYALVISSGDGEIADAITLTEQPTVSVNVPYVGASTNTFDPSTTPGYSGTLLLGQHVGANTPLLGVTDGMTNQWHFYVLTNSESYPNAAFITFLPNTLSIPRLGVNESKLGNATREEADIDLYVSTDPGLLGLDPNVIAQCAANSGPNFSSSRTRGGTEVIVYSNAVPGGVYYIGVKAEDQMAAEYGFLGVFSLLPFSEDDNGNPVLRGFPAPMVIPDGSPSAPGAGFMFAVGIRPMSLRRVVVTDTVTHENFGDLVGSLSHNGQFAVLNNHTFGGQQIFPDPTTRLFIYEDNGEGNIIGAQHTDGPGNLRNFVGEQGVGLWLLQMVDDSRYQTGRLEGLSIRLEPQNLSDNGTPRTVEPMSWTYDFIEVPSTASNLTVCVWSNTLPMELYIRRGEFPTRTEYDKMLTVNPPGDCLSINRADLPPLTAGRYYIGVYNPNAVAQTILLTAKLDLDLAAIVPVSFTSGSAIPIQDDAVTYATQFVTNHARIASVEVGLRVDHPRISDLAFTLVSPTGTRVLLMEDRGWTNSANIGSSLYQTNTTTIVDSFETIPPNTYVSGSVMGDWTVTTNSVTVISNTTLAHTGQNVLSLRDGAIQRNYATTPGAYYTLSFASRLDGIVSWWPAETNATDVVDGNHGTLVNNATYDTGMVGGSFALGGDNDAVMVGTNSNLQLQDFSIEGWVKRSDLVVLSQNTTGDGAIFSVGAEGGGFAFYLKDSSNKTNIGQLALGKSQISLVKSVSRVADTNWHHVAVTKLGTRVVFYLDGIADPPLVYNSGGFAFNAPAHIGAWWNPSLPDFYNPDHSFWGAIDELTVYNRELTASEIQAIFNDSSAGKCGQPVQQTSCLSQGAQVTVVGHVTNTVASSSSTRATNVITFTGTQTNTLVEFAARGRDSGLLLDTVSLVESLVLTQNFYLTFTEATNLTLMPIKFATPPFEPPTNPVVQFLSGFETLAAGNYDASASPFEGWTAFSTNPVSVIQDPALAYAGEKFLALAGGTITRTLPTRAGLQCRLSHAYRGPGIVGFWRGENNAADSIYGNNGSVQNISYATGEVGQAFVSVYNFPPPHSRISVPDQPIFALTNSLSIDGWINPAGAAGDLGGIIIWRGDCRQGYDPYFFQVNPDNTLGFYIEDGSGGPAAAVVTPTAPAFNQWSHVAATLDGNTGGMSIYVNGVLAAQTITSMRPFGPLDPSLEPTLGIGNVGTSCWDYVPFNGNLDEISLYSRALSGSEVKAIYDVGSAGKFDPAATGTEAFAKAQITIGGGVPGTFYGDNSNWQTQMVAFTANQDGTDLTVTGLEPGMLLDSFTLTELPGNLCYLPEESLKALQDEDAFGTWTLEILDTRVGATIPPARLLDWQLNFVFQNDIPIPGVLLHGEPQTNTVPAGMIAYYVVDVPAWAQFATNTLIFATDPLNIWFNQDTPPFGTNAGDYLLIGAATSGSATLSAASTPPLLSGRRYYLGVQNTNLVAVTFALEVDFDITALLNGVPVTSTLNPGALPRYFYYDVSTNATAVSFKLYNLSGNVDLVARKGAPLPTLTSFDYGSFNPAALDDEILVFTNSTPVALSPGRWYLGVFNQDAVPVTNTIVAMEFTNAFGNIIDLTNGVPYFNTNAGPSGALDYYHYLVSAGAVRAQFEVNGPSGDVTLVARKGLPLPDLTTFDYLSSNPGTNDELIVLFTNSLPVALSGGDWYLAVANLTVGPVSYAIKATEWPAGTPALVITNVSISSTSFCLTWTSLPGVAYHVDGLTNLNSTTWVTVSPTIVATTNFTTWCIALPSPFHFFRVVEGPALNLYVPPPAFTGMTRQTNGILLRWTGSASRQYELDWSPTLAPPAWTNFSNIFTSPTGLFSFLDDGSQTSGLGAQRFYRVLQLP